MPRRTWNIIVTSLTVRFGSFFEGMTDKIVVLNTCAHEEEAERIARLLVDRRLAACVSIVPRVRSFYRWKGAVESSEEWLLLIKSSRPLFDQLRAAIEVAHSYEVPEVLALPVVDGAAPYLDWLGANLREGPAAE
jgi:periplasmic divalent cation tolerance protein